MSSPTPLGAALKTWISGVVLGPVFFALIGLASGFIRPNYLSYGAGVILQDFLLFMTGGAVFSLPSLVAVWIGLYWIKRKSLPAKTSLFFILALSGLAECLPFLLFTVRFGWNNTLYYLIPGYLAATWLGVFWAMRRVGQRQKPPDAAEPLDANL